MYAVCAMSSVNAVCSIPCMYICIHVQCCALYIIHHPCVGACSNTKVLVHNVAYYDSVVVTAYDSESGRPGSNPEWGQYTMRLRSLHRVYSSLHPFGVVHWVPEQLTKKAVTGACKLIDGCSLALCSTTVSVVSAGICHRNEVNSTA